MPVGGDLAGVFGHQRRADVRRRVLEDERLDDCADGGVERGIARRQRLALQEHALAGRLLEPGVDNLVDAAGLARPGVFASIFFVPITRPSAKSATTVPSQPKIAILRWRALQSAMRADRLCCGEELDMWLPTLAFRADRSGSTLHAGRVLEPDRRAGCSGATPLTVAPVSPEVDQRTRLRQGRWDT